MQLPADGRLRVIINSLEKDSPGLEESISAILSNEQLVKLDQRTMLGEIRKLGSVNSILSGLIGQRLDLSDGDRDQVFEPGKDLQAKLEVDLEQTAIDLAVQEFGLEEVQAKRILSILR